jgi:hypothetical protein
MRVLEEAVGLRGVLIKAMRIAIEAVRMTVESGNHESPFRGRESDLEATRELVDFIRWFLRLESA